MRFSVGLPDAHVPREPPDTASPSTLRCFRCGRAASPHPRSPSPGLPWGGAWVFAAGRTLPGGRPGATWGQVFWGSDTMLAQEGRALPKGPRPQRGRAGGEGEAGDPPTLGLCRGSALGAPVPCPGTGRPGRAAGGGTGRDGGGGAPTAGRGHGEKPLGSARSGAGDRRLGPTQRTLQTARPRCPASAFSQPVG